MKKLILLLIIANVFLLKAQQKALVIPENAKIGLALSGGGAKGFAHIGVIKVLDSLGVKISYVSGTSMGAIIGGMYASGYTGKEMEEILKKTDISAILVDEKLRSEVSFFNKSNEKYFISFPIKDKKIRLPSSLSKGQRTIYFLNDIFKDVRGIKDFKKLPIPFLCVATNLETGKEKIFENGEITNAIMASAAFPSLLDPVKIGDSLYIDGGVSINYPVELLKKKGMDIVIGVNLDQGLDKAKDMNNFIKILGQIINFGIEKNYREQEKIADIDIKPNLKGIGITSYENKEKVIDSGFVKALEFIPQLKKLPQNSFVRIKSDFSRNPILSNVYKIDRVMVENSDRYDINYIKGKMGIKTPTIITYDRLKEMIDRLYSTDNYKLIRYEITQEDDENILTLNVTESTDYHFIKAGLHYDKVFSSGLLLNFSSRKFLFHNSNLSLDLVIGNSPRYYFNYFIDNGYIPGFGINSSAFGFSFNNSDNKIISNKWNLFRNEVYIESILGEIIGFGGGFSYDYFEKENIGASVVKEKYINPFFFIKTDNQDNYFFPTKGILFNAEAKFYNFNSTNVSDKSFQVNANLHLNYSFGKKITLQSKSYMGITIDNAPESYKYYLGGYFQQKIINFHTFASREIGEIKTNNVLSLDNGLQIKVFNNLYVIPNIHLLSTYENLSDFGIFKFNYKSVGLSAAYNSPIGEVRLNYSQDLSLKKGVFNFTFGYWF